MAETTRGYVQEQAHRLAVGTRGAWALLLEKGPSQFQFWLIALVIGVLAGFAALFFRKGISWLQSTLYGVDDVRMLHSFAESLPWWVILIIPVGGGLVVEGRLANRAELDAIIAEDFAGLRREREATDAASVEYVAGLTEDDLANEVTYTPVINPTTVRQPLAPALLHAFNHQTHHRGQAHALLTRLTGDAPSLDLIYYQRQTGEGIRDWAA